jgi:hypothetical protein
MHTESPVATDLAKLGSELGLSNAAATTIGFGA